MLGRRVERVEAVPFVFNVRSVSEREAHSPKNLDRPLEHLRERMERADFVLRSGQRDVDLSERIRFLLRSKLLRAQVDRGSDRTADFVEQFADDWLFFTGERFHLLAPGRNAAAAAEIFHPCGFEGLLVARGFDLAQRVVSQLFEWVHESGLKMLQELHGYNGKATIVTL